MFRLLIDEPGGYLFHCTQGKDRTGIAAALILAALEVPEDVIRDDYLQTNLYMSTEMPAFVDTFEALLGPKAHADIDEFLVASPLYSRRISTPLHRSAAPSATCVRRLGSVRPTCVHCAISTSPMTQVTEALMVLC